MANINLPKEILEKAALKSLPAKQKEEYYNNLVKRILEMNPEGISISQIKDSVNMPASTIWHHLEILKSTAQCRKISHGNLDMYHPIGNKSHVKEFNMNKVIYSLDTIENSEGNFACLQELRENRLGTNIILRGLCIPFELIDELTSTLKKVKGTNTKKKTKK